MKKDHKGVLVAGESGVAATSRNRGIPSMMLPWWADNRDYMNIVKMAMPQSACYAGKQGRGAHPVHLFRAGAGSYRIPEQPRQKANEFEKIQVNPTESNLEKLTIYERQVQMRFAGCLQALVAGESGVALRFPPQSKMLPLRADNRGYMNIVNTATPQSAGCAGKQGRSAHPVHLYRAGAVGGESDRIQLNPTK